MVVASKSAVYDRSPSPTSRTRGATALNPSVIPLPLKAKGLPTRASSSGQIITVLPSSQSAPFWLLRLYAIQHRSSVVASVLLVAMVMVYGWTAYSQKMWSQAYSKLKTLQHHERQLTTTNEMLKNKMALQAEQSATGLVPPNPASMLFLQPAPKRPAPAVDSVAAQTQQPQPAPLPLGY